MGRIVRCRPCQKEIKMREAAFACLKLRAQYIFVYVSLFELLLRAGVHTVHCTVRIHQPDHVIGWYFINFIVCSTLRINGWRFDFSTVNLKSHYLFELLPSRMIYLIFELKLTRSNLPFLSTRYVRSLSSMWLIEFNQKICNEPFQDIIIINAWNQSQWQIV